MQRPERYSLERINKYSVWADGFQPDLILVRQIGKDSGLLRCLLLIIYSLLKIYSLRDTFLL